MGKDLKGKELGEGITQRSNETYHARFVDRFGKRQSFYSKDKREIKELLNKAVYEDKMCMNVVDTSTTLDAWYQQWLDIHKYKVIRENTKRQYVQIYQKHIKPTLGKTKLREITQLNVKGLLKKLDKKGYGFETQNKVRILLLDMFNKAMIDHYANENPARGIRLVRDEKKDVRVLSPDEQTDFFDCCRGTFYDNFFTVAISTGLRPGELCALIWEDIDFKKKEISVTRTLLYQKFEGDEKKIFHIGPPKTRSSIRKIPINKQCETALKKQKLQHDIIMSKASAKPVESFEDLLFTTKFGTPINSQIICDAIKAIINEINICRDELEQFENFSGHCFRHSFATRCFEAGIQPKTVQMYLGHATLQMTMDLYTHVLDDHKQEEMLKLENTLDEVMNNGDELTEQRFENGLKNEMAYKNKVVDMNGVRMA